MQGRRELPSTWVESMLSGVLEEVNGSEIEGEPPLVLARQRHTYPLLKRHPAFTPWTGGITISSGPCNCIQFSGKGGGMIMHCPRCVEGGGRRVSAAIMWGDRE